MLALLDFYAQPPSSLCSGRNVGGAEGCEHTGFMFRFSGGLHAACTPDVHRRHVWCVCRPVCRLHVLDSLSGRTRCSAFARVCLPCSGCSPAWLCWGRIRVAWERIRVACLCARCVTSSGLDPPPHHHHHHYMASFSWTYISAPPRMSSKPERTPALDDNHTNCSTQGPLEKSRTARGMRVVTTSCPAHVASHYHTAEGGGCWIRAGRVYKCRRITVLHPTKLGRGESTRPTQSRK